MEEPNLYLRAQAISTASIRREAVHFPGAKGAARTHSKPEELLRSHDFRESGKAILSVKV
jgi:hypothetical protein